MTWVLFVWFYGGIATQEFNTHKACVDAALAMRQSMGAEGVKSEFLCVEKGKVKK